MEKELKIKIREESYKKNLINRINRVEGQVKGIKQMILDDRYCDDVLIQISAVSASLKKVGLLILENHMNTCLVNDIKSGKNEIINDLLKVIEKL